MEHVIAIIPILVLLMAGPTNSAQAASSSSLANNCVTQLLGLYPCLDFVTNGKVDSVSPQCCSAIEATVKANVMCLCLLFTNNSEIVGVSINQTKALLLPTLCKIVVPPVSTCENVADDVMGAQVNDSTPVPKGLASGNRRLSPRDIPMSPTQSVTSGTTSKTHEEPIKEKS
eukprot:PITA_18719